MTIGSGQLDWDINPENYNLPSAIGPSINFENNRAQLLVHGKVILNTIGKLPLRSYLTNRPLYVSVLGLLSLMFTLTFNVPKVLFYLLSYILSLITFKVQSHFTLCPASFHISTAPEKYIENTPSIQIMLSANHDPTFSFYFLHKSIILYYAVI